MKLIRLTSHAQEQCVERGATEAEVRQAIEQGSREPAKMGRERYAASISPLVKPGRAMSMPSNK